MPERAHGSVPELFDNVTLADVKTRLIHDGQQVCESSAHKVMLCMESEFFRKAFTGSFKEANEDVMLIHDGHPVHFELMLKYTYDGQYYKQSINNISGTAEDKQILVAIGIWRLADKYGMPTLASESENHMHSIFGNAGKDDFKTLEAAIHEHYRSNPGPDTKTGGFVTQAVLKYYKTYLNTNRLEQATRDYSTFGSDMMLALKRNGKFSQTEVKCRYFQCNFKSTLDVQHMQNFDIMLSCPRCGGKTNLPKLEGALL